ncbi:Transmembrane emp24 domain-containing protein 10 [Balamuthia mandrillaris]
MRTLCSSWQSWLGALTLLVLLCGSSLVVSAIKFDLEHVKPKCFKEELSRDVLVTGDFSTKTTPAGEPAMTLSFDIRDPMGQLIWGRTAEEGHFAFTTEDGGEFEFCFKDTPIQGVRIPRGYSKRVSLELKTGTEAKDYKEVASRENLSKMEVEVRRMEDSISDVLKEMKYMRRREEKMRSTNESTNSRVVWLSVFSLVILIGLGVWQIFYLKQYFHHKKLL